MSQNLITSSNSHVRQQATVVAMDDIDITLNTIRLTTCQQCAMKAGCGQRLLARASNCERSQIKVAKPTAMTLRLGQEVTIAVPQQTFLVASLWVFLVPLLCMLTAALAGQYWFGDQIYIALCGLVGLVVGLMAMRWRVQKMQQSDAWHPVVLNPGSHSS